MKTIGTLIQALLLAGATVYFIPHLVAGVLELINYLLEDQ